MSRKTYKIVCVVGLLLITQWVLAQRDTVSLNFGWQFQLNDSVFKESVQTVNLPHDFQIGQPWIAPDKNERPDHSDMAANVRSRLSSRGFKEMGVGWYRKMLRAEKAWQGKRIPAYETFDEKNRKLLDHWASWDGYRLSQGSADAFSIRKRANANNPWIGTFSGTRSEGYAFVGDVSGGMGLALHDFWQSYPSALEVSDARQEKALLTAWLWSPDAEPMDLRHYDNVAHDLNASYEDVQEGLSTPYGIARTHTLTLVPQGGYQGKADFARKAHSVTALSVLLPTPEYLHRQEAFGIWSLPDRTNAFRSRVEDRLDAYIDLYQKAIEQNKWYGF